jgi:hypothetical protein
MRGLANFVHVALILGCVAYLVCKVRLGGRS